MAAGGQGGDLQSQLAAKAMEDPRVQQAVKEQAMKQGQAAFEAGSATYCESVSRYWDVVRKMPQITPFGETFACSKETPADYQAQFKTMNVLFMQTQAIAVPIYVILFLIASMTKFALWTFLRGIVTCLGYCLVLLFCSHMSYYYIVERGGCCGGCGYALWAVMYLLMVCSCLFLSVPGSSIWSIIIRCIYIPSVIPAVYIVIITLKLGGAEAIKHGCTKCFEACKGNQSSEIRSPNLEAGKGTAMPPAPPASTNPNNRLE